MDSLFLLGALSLCGLVQAYQSTALSYLKQDALSMESNVQCDEINCDCTFNQQVGCCGGANDMFTMEDEVSARVKALNADIRNLKMLTEQFKTERKVAFQASMTEGVGTTSSGGVTCLGPFNSKMPIPFDKVILNEGNWYNPILGIFTAPRDAVYVFSFTIASTNEDMYELRHKVVLIRERESVVAIMEINSRDSQDSATQYVILSLTKGNQVYLELQSARKICSSFSSNIFSGFLLHTINNASD